MRLAWPPQIAVGEFKFGALPEGALASTVVRVLLTLAIVAAGAAAAALLYELGVSRRAVFYMAAVIFAGATFGARYGLLAALVSLLLFDFFVDEPLYAITLGSKQNLVNAVLFGAGALLSGAYADRYRRQQAVTRALLDATKSFPGAAVDHPAWRTLAAAQPDGSAGVAKEALGIAGGLVIVAAAALLAYLARKWLGVDVITGAFVAATVAAAVIVGARAALVAALAGVVASNVLFEAPFGLSLGAPQDAANLLLFAGVAWIAGGAMERIREERRMSRTALEASLQLTTIDQESQLRATLHKAIRLLSGIDSAWVLDESGASAEGSPPLPAELAAVRAAASGPGTHERQFWRIRPLQAGGRDLGAIIWLSPDVEGGEGADQQRTIEMLGDLAAAAILRVRLNLEKTERELAEQTERLRSAMLSSMSHDFRTPLAGILGSATSLLELGDKYDAAQRTDLLLNVRDQALRLNRYVDNLLSLTRLEAGVLRVVPCASDIEPIVYDAWEALGDAGGARRILDARIPRDAKANFDPVLFHQALTNVLENALKYSPPDSTVRIEAFCERDRFVLEVLDEGHGAAADELESIFERFYRGRGANAPGTGLGLYIARCLLETMDGLISARQRSGGGLIVSMSLPAHEPALTEAT
ncbi:MAG: PAS domain-containing sensor histidine kinase [Hyphomonadaceae bacterium]|nr:PAS domain-containing sensor histidine kinase [Hyphomonadaceae bacterium]